MLSSLVASAAIVATVEADARTDYLVRALRTSSMFRVRAQAAISLGSVDAEPQVTRALTDALDDRHPVVRAAACSSLRRQGDPSALDAVRAMSRDREAAVRRSCAAAQQELERRQRSAPQRRAIPGRGTSGSSSGSAGARFYVAVGPIGTKARGIDRSALESGRELIRRTVAGMSGVRVAPENESARSARSAIGSMTGYYLDSSIVSVEETSQGLRARVSVVVQSYPDRNIRSMLQGGATVPGGRRGTRAERDAIEGALRGALRNLPQAMAASAGSSSPPSRGRRRRRR